MSSNSENEVKAETLTTTLGEELWQIHMRRVRNKTNSEQKARIEPLVSVGEELWRVHCQRLQGNMDEKALESKSASQDARVILLRGRDVTVG